MGSVSKPLLALLAATVLGAALWMVALKPASGGGASAPASRPAAASRPTAGSAKGAAIAPARPAERPVAPARQPARRVRHVQIGDKPSGGAGAAPRSAPASAPAAVDAALRAGRVVAILFYNPGSADDLAVRSELMGLNTPRRVLKLAVPSAQIASYPAITVSIPITITPTLMIIDPRHQATVITGFASSFEIAERIEDALKVRPLGAG
jgi:hypothetical protein